MRLVVLDASVVAKLFLQEDHCGEVSAIKDRHIAGELEVMLPSLLKYELINLLLYRKFSVGDMKSVIEVISDYGFVFVDPENKTLDKIIEFSEKYRITAYDASYIALGYALNADVYTADEKLLGKVKGLHFVKHIKDYD